MLYSKTLSSHPTEDQEDQKLVFKTDYCLMQVKSTPREHSAILSTFIKLPFVFKIFVLSIFEWRLKTGFTVTVITSGFLFGLEYNEGTYIDSCQPWHHQRILA